LVNGSGLSRGAQRSWAQSSPGARIGRSAARRGIEELYEEEVWRVYGFFAYRVRSRSDAEDLTQITFERALRAWDRFDPDRGSARTWLMSIAKNLLIDHYRRDRDIRQEPVEDHLSRPELTVDDKGVGISPEVAAALDDLGERERELIALRFGGGLTGPEIAGLTGLTLANVQQIMSRSLRKMHSRLAGAR
jgi:RNA polymerase sigma-70 factor (ECF subfamily)